MGAKGIVCGENYRFGYQARGDAQLMRELGEKYDIPIKVVELVTTSAVFNSMDEDASISSSRITSLLSTGEMTSVSKMLGRRYRLVADLAKVKSLGFSGGDTNGSSASPLSLPLDCFLNMVPGVGTYPVLLTPSKHSDNTNDASESPRKGWVTVGERELSIQTENDSAGKESEEKMLDLVDSKALLSIDFA